MDLARDYNTNFLKSIGVQVIVDDIRNQANLFKAAKGCDYIINCAAQPAMTIALEKPSFDCSNNIVGTLNVLETGKEYGIPVAICSTIHVYGNGINDEIKEQEDKFYRDPSAIEETHKILTGDITPLHVSKYTTELYARAFEESYDSRVFTARLTGIYGPHQLGGEDHGWVANFAVRTLLGLPIKVFGTDKQVRDILYVKDAAQAFYDWYQNSQVSGVYNIGGGVLCITSIRQCLQMLSNITEIKQSITLEPARKGDLWYFCCDITKANQAFKWAPKVLPQDGLPKLVEWIKENQRLFKE